MGNDPCVVVRPAWGGLPATLSRPWPEILATPPAPAGDRHRVMGTGRCNVPMSLPAAIPSPGSCVHRGRNHVGITRALPSGAAHERVRLMGMKRRMNVLPAARVSYSAGAAGCSMKGDGGLSRAGSRRHACGHEEVGKGATGPAWPGHAGGPGGQ
ncbi:hypothetical protein KTQ54_14690 [Komagataeibacter oboediens]|uniref:hypothetical protein n=1 Tax=Komagataeibacter oboediens TaxID=65958 RepID=UPI001C2C8701|nr:hypothetical protein [Komagataeibacter oboediens]MBV0889763.1 hypothetical protein [Komagataeibacter oboediens]MCK9821332.1 hypothetical protein [Komagataeibacter oboediens]